jgi:hypothetical protein
MKRFLLPLTVAAALFVGAAVQAQSGEPGRCPNGYVCAFELRGTRAYLDNPYVDLTFFGISDDEVGK